MNLVRIGFRVLNLERVNYIEDHPGNDAMYLYFSAPLAQHGLESLQSDYVKLEGAEAKALRRYLDRSGLCEALLHPDDARNQARPSVIIHEAPDDIPF